MEKLLTVEECAERTGFTVNWMRTILRDGEVACIRIGNEPEPGRKDNRKYMVAPSDLEAYLQAKKSKPRIITVRDKTVDEWRKESIRRRYGNHQG